MNAVGIEQAVANPFCGKVSGRVALQTPAIAGRLPEIQLAGLFPDAPFALADPRSRSDCC